jgi:hypothetical protein
LINQTPGRRQLVIARKNQCYDKDEEGSKSDEDDIGLLEEATPRVATMASDNMFHS